MISTKKHIMLFLVGLSTLPLIAFAQTVTTNNNPDNPLPPGTADNLETTAQQIESSTAAQYQFKNEGIFGCNQVAGANASAGTMAAIGGVYVPVTPESPPNPYLAQIPERDIVTPSGRPLTLRNHELQRES